MSFVADTLQNTYLIAINVTNRQKERYYNEYVPDLMNVRRLYQPGCMAVILPAANLGISEYASTFRITRFCFEWLVEHGILPRDTNDGQIDSITGTSFFRNSTK
jgi:hypothetical protein